MANHWMELLLTDRFYTALFSTGVFWLVALLLSGISYLFLDKILLRGLHFGEELRKGNMAVALVIAAWMLGMFLVIFGITN